MSDGLGSVTYNYNNLARLTSETRNFNAVGSYTLTYGYNLAGELASITNPWSAQVSYAYDKAGRATAVNGSGYMGVPNYASAITYRAFGSLKGMNYGNGRSLATAYDNRLRPTTWNVASVLGYNYNYDYFNEHTGRVTYAQNIQDPTLDRSYEYDHAGRLAISHSGAEARAHAYSGQWGTMDGPYSQGYDFDVWGNVTHKYGWGGEVQGGTAGQSSDKYYTYTGNRRDGFSYDLSGNLTNDLGQTFTYDATGQQATAAYGGYSLQQSYDGNGLRAKKTENGAITYYLRSSILGGQVVAEMSGSGVFQRSYIYLGGQLLALKLANGYSYWVHEDPITKSKRVTDMFGAVTSTIELDPWGAEVGIPFSNNTAFQPKKFTSYERDVNGSDEAMFRRYNRWHSRFDQPDSYDGSYSLTNPQSFNRYAYVLGDPANYVDPTGLLMTGQTCIVATAGTHWFSGNKYVFSTISSQTVFCTWGAAALKTGGGGNPQNPLSAKEATDAIVKQVNALLKNKLCKSFLNSVLSALNTATGVAPINSTFSGVFKDRSKNPGFYDGSGVIDDYGLTELNNGRLSIGVDFSRATPTGLYSVGITAIHETIHAAASQGLYSQYRAAEAAYTVGRQMGLIPDLVGPAQTGDSKAANAYNSQLLSNAIFAACGKQ